MFLILGSAKSGTTLLRRLFYAFPEIENIHQYISLEQVKAGPFVAKLKKRYVMSRIGRLDRVSRAEIDMLKNKQIKKVCIVRDGREVIASGFTSVPAWVYSIQEYQKYKDYVDVLVYYDDLVAWPDKVQQELVDIFGLSKRFSFSEYPCFVPVNIVEQEGFSGMGESYVLRPIKKTRKVIKNNKIPINYQKRFNSLCSAIKRRQL